MWEIGEVRRALWRSPVIDGNGHASKEELMVAWKKIRGLKDDATLLHFRREIEMLGHLSHPNIVHVSKTIKFI